MQEVAIKILCQAFAEYARIEGMRAANMARVMNNESLAYPEEEFLISASHLEQLAMEVINSCQK